MGGVYYWPAFRYVAAACLARGLQYVLLFEVFRMRFCYSFRLYAKLAEKACLNKVLLHCSALS
jgi:hypothetical protein